MLVYNTVFKIVGLLYSKQCMHKLLLQFQGYNKRTKNEEGILPPKPKDECQVRSYTVV